MMLELYWRTDDMLNKKEYTIEDYRAATQGMTPEQKLAWRRANKSLVSAAVKSNKLNKSFGNNLPGFVSGIQDGAKAVGKGIWNGATMVGHTALGAASGLTNAALLANDAAARPFLWGAAKLAWRDKQRAIRNNYNGYFDSLANKLQGYNELVQGTYQYNNPDLSSLKVAETAGAVLPAVSSLGWTPAMRMASPITANTVNSIAMGSKLVPNAAKNYVSWLASGSKAAGAVRNSTAAVVTALPMVDYLTGAFRKTKETSTPAAVSKDVFGKYLPLAAAIANPAAFGNLLYTRIPEVYNSKMLGLMRAGSNVLPTYVPENTSVASEVSKAVIDKAPNVKGSIKNWWGSSNKWHTLYNNTIDTTRYLNDIFDGSVPRTPTAFVKGIRKSVVDKPNNKYLRLTGLQPITKAPHTQFADRLTGNTGITSNTIERLGNFVKGFPRLSRPFIGVNKGVIGAYQPIINSVFNK